MQYIVHIKKTCVLLLISCVISLLLPSIARRRMAHLHLEASLRESIIQSLISAEIISSPQYNFNSLIWCPRTRRQRIRVVFSMYLSFSHFLRERQSQNSWIRILSYWQLLCHFLVAGFCLPQPISICLILFSGQADSKVFYQEA